MTRELKFRVLYDLPTIEDKHNNVPFTPYWHYFSVWASIDPFRCKDQNKTVGQYTGRKDATKWEDRPEKYKDVKEGDWKGIEIYKGDIIETHYEYINDNPYNDVEDEYGIYRGLVHYQPSKGFIQTRVIKRTDEDCSWSKRSNLEIRQSYTKVISNIHENPELLTG